MGTLRQTNFITYNSMLAIAFCLILFLGVRAIFQQLKKQQKTRPLLQIDNRANSIINRQILTMLAGDKQAALRLIKNVRQRYPGKSSQWYRKKIIRDLERDRRF